MDFASKEEERSGSDGSEDIGPERKVLASLDRLERIRGVRSGLLETIRASHEFRNPYVVDAMAEHGRLFAFGSNLDPEQSGSGNVPEEDDHERLARAEREHVDSSLDRKRTREELDSVEAKEAFDPHRGRVLGRLTREEAERAVLEAKEAVSRSRSKKSSSR